MNSELNSRTLTVYIIMAFILAWPSQSFAKEGTWTIKSDLPTARYGLSASMVNGRIYAIGGRANYETFSTVEEYDPATDTWTRKADMPTPRDNLSTSVVNGKIYAIGGVDGSINLPTAIVEEYDPATNTWRRRADMPSERWKLSTSAVNGKIYAIGGLHRGGTGLPETTVEEYDPATNTWRARADMPRGRHGLSTGAVDGKIYAIGGSKWSGVTQSGTYFSTVEEYDPAMDTWRGRADMPTARSGLSTSVVDGKIYAIGGQASQEIVCLSTVEVYDPVTDTWMPKVDMMPTARSDFGASVVDGRIYAIGGQSGPWPAVTSSVEAYQAVPWGFAHAPNPADGSLYPNTEATLSWEAGDFAVSHNVYLGDSFDDVNEGFGDTFRGNHALTFLDAGIPGSPYPDGLIPGATYYWRIDEVNDLNPNSPWKGSVWSFTIHPNTAYNPDPADGAEFVNLNVELSWRTGFNASSRFVYFSEDFDDVNNAVGGLLITTSTYRPPRPLEFARTYYWRVDEFEGGRNGGIHRGDVWSFTTRGAAVDPHPSNGTTSVEMNPTLSWASTDYAASYQVYLGTDKEAVRAANIDSPEYQGLKVLGDESCDPGTLSWNTTYYWRVDEVNSVHPESPWRGGVWSFTTGDFFVVDDFEDYTSGSNEIWWSWKDGVGYDDHPTEPPYPGNGTGSMVGDISNIVDEYAYRAIGGSQFMPYWYDNDKDGFLKYSEATLILTSPRDWTENGVSMLSVWTGADWDYDRNTSPNDDEPLYIVLNDSAVVYHDNPYITEIFNWTEWRIELQEFEDLGVDLTNVHTIGIGFGDRNNPQPGGEGLMFFDEVRLYRLSNTASE